MFLKSEKKQASSDDLREIKAKRLLAAVSIVLCSTLLLAVIAIFLNNIFSTNRNVYANVSVHAGPSPNTQVHQDQDLHYPDPSDQSKLPDSVKVTGEGETVLLRATVSEGRQIYDCQTSTTDPSGYAWKFQAPFALLKADDGTNVIHSTDPTWLYTQDGSEVEGHVGQYSNPDGTIISATATPDANSIPWLRLDVTVHRGNNGLFSRVDQIQRLYTEGGKAPKGGCNRDAASSHVIQSIAYTAEYVFWGQ